MLCSPSISRVLTFYTNDGWTLSHRFSGLEDVLLSGSCCRGMLSLSSARIFLVFTIEHVFCGIGKSAMNEASSPIIISWSIFTKLHGAKDYSTATRSAFGVRSYLPWLPIQLKIILIWADWFDLTKVIAVWHNLRLKYVYSCRMLVCL